MHTTDAKGELRMLYKGSLTFLTVVHFRCKRSRFVNIMPTTTTTTTQSYSYKACSSSSGGTARAIGTTSTSTSVSDGAI